jgi:hypothetical protein
MPSLLCDAGTLGKIWSSCEYHEIRYTELRMNKYVYLYNLMYFYVENVQ